mmetsp:Transcript_26160/g.85938  ORF Transcript_26160/g.85938 Transcript_26160/m.85938 type:complete len:1224 (+) Transcript_26160:40-3711(+)
MAHLDDDDLMNMDVGDAGEEDALMADAGNDGVYGEGYEEGEQNGEGEEEEEEEEITADDSWVVISSYFEQKGLVRQQLDSFDEFMENTMQEIVDEAGDIVVESQNQYMPGQEGFTKRRYKINFGQIYLSKPMMTESNGDTDTLFPKEARLRNLTYSAPLYVDMSKTVTEIDEDGNEDQGEPEEYGKIFIGKVPIMLRSNYCSLFDHSDKDLMDLGECPYDQGGYFIINGSEKVLIAQEKMSTNHVYVFKKRQPAKHSFVCEIRSMPDSFSRVASSCSVRMLGRQAGKGRQNATISVQIPYIRQEIPLIIVFRALGFVADKDILEHIVYDLGDNAMMDLLRPSLEEAQVIMDREVALDYIGKRGDASAGGSIAVKADRIQYAKEILQKELLPHVGTEEFCETKKAYFLGYMVHRLLMCCLDRREEDDRDHYGNKRLDLAGPLLGMLFRQLFRRLTKDVRSYCQQCIDKGKDISVTYAVKSNTITRGLKYSLATGNWGQQGSADMRAGVSQVLNRLTYASTLSHLRRMNSPIGREGKLAKPRQLHNSHWGMICPAETPEGAAVGLVKNLALMAYISVGSPSAPILEFLEEWQTENLEEISPSVIPSATKIFVNGCWVGVHRDPQSLVDTVRKLRRHLDITTEVGVVHDIRLQELRLYTDAGRCCRPLYIAERQKLRIKRKHIMLLADREHTDFTWNSLLENGLIEYVDTEEEETTMIAMELKDLHRARQELELGTDSFSVTYTHCEIHPSMILGVCGSIIPFPDHNQSPRNTYQSAMGKQAMGIYATNFQQRFDTLAYVLFYPQKPLVKTKTIELIGYDQLGAGQNATVAVMSYSGYDIEDALVMNKSSLDRGFGRCIVLRKYSSTIRKYANRTSDRIVRPMPSQTKGTQLLDADGIAQVGQQIHPGDIYLNKQSPVNTRDPTANPSLLPDDFFKPSPQVFKGPPGEHGMVDKVLLTNTDEGQYVVKMLVRQTRRPEVGDKFSSRHGQKGVCGTILQQENFPFTDKGLCPDLIMNPHGFPSRMTVGKMLELLGSKAAVCTGKFHYGTAFGGNPVGEMSATLVDHGFSYCGKDFLTCGITGEPLQVYVFMGPVYYQKLKHMVLDKMHARARGPRVVLTRQPTEGRSRDGGLRLGEMERDCLIGYGASALVLERLMISSDQFEVHVCRKCGLMGYYLHHLRQGMCSGCKTGEYIHRMKLPYAAKLLFQELSSMNVACRLSLSSQAAA